MPIADTQSDKHLRLVITLIPSHVSGQGYKTGPIPVHVCVRLLVSALLAELFDMRIRKFGTGVNIDNISDEFEGQGHRSKAKVAILENMVLIG